MSRCMYYTQIESEFEKMDELERLRQQAKSRKKRSNEDWQASSLPKTDLYQIDDAAKVEKYRNNMWPSFEDPYELRSQDTGLVDAISYKTRELHTAPLSPHKVRAGNTKPAFNFSSSISSTPESHRHDEALTNLESSSPSLLNDNTDETQYNDDNYNNSPNQNSPSKYPKLGSRSHTVQSNNSSLSPRSRLGSPSMQYKVNLMTYKSPHGAISPYTREYYFISFQIEHPRILQGWRFKLVVKDTCEQTKSYEISNLDVDNDNFLQFKSNTLSPPNIFSPADMLPWVHEAKELMGRELNFTVYSLSPAFKLILSKCVLYNTQMKTERYDGSNIARIGNSPIKSPSPPRLPFSPSVVHSGFSNSKVSCDGLTPKPSLLMMNNHILLTASVRNETTQTEDEEQ